MSASFESARRAASYLGSAPAIALAPSTPIWLPARPRVFRGVLKNPLRNEQRKGNRGVNGR